MRNQLKIFLAVALAFISLTSENASAVESNRIWVELNGAENVTASKSIELFVLRAGYGHHIISNFDKYDSKKRKDTFDKLLFDYGSYSDIMEFGSTLYDKQIITSLTATFYVEAVDINSDGITDTKISVGNDSVTLLSVAPNEIRMWQLMGG